MHSNPLVATGVIPANLYNSFVIPEMNQPKQKPPQVVTKSCLLTSDEHVAMYNKKVTRKRQTEEAKQKRKDKREQRKEAKEKQKKQGTRAAFELVVERETDSTYHLKKQLQKKK